MWLVPSEARELIADFDDAVLVGFEKEADVAMIDHRDALILGGFLWRQLHVSIYPGLSLQISIDRNKQIWLQSRTFEQHCSSRSTNVGLQAPAARTTLSA